MRRTAFVLALLLCCVGLHAQNYNMNLHNAGSVIYTEDVNNINRITFEGSLPANMLINQESGIVAFPITAFDSITFSWQEPAEYTITANANNNAWGSVSGGGVYSGGATCTLTATPASGYQFDSWKKDDVVVSLNPVYSFTVTEDATYTAYFAETPVTYYTITTEVTPTGAGTVTGGGYYPAGTNVTLTATANVGYSFSQWNDGNTQSTRTITVTGDATYTASFTQNTYTITTAASPTSGGTVTGGGTYHYGDTPTLTATANTGFTFSQWHDGNSDNPRRITVTGDATYTANFTEEPTPPTGDTVYITYSVSSVEVVNPFVSDGVTVSTSSADVTVNATRSNVPYVVSGSSTNGSLTINSSNPFFMALSSLSLTSGSTAAINIATPAAATLNLRGSSTIADNANSPINGALYAAGALTVNGSGTLQITGNAKHGILVDGIMTVDSGTINIVDTDSDGIHGSSNLVWNNGTLNIAAAGSDGLDFSGTVAIANGNLTIHTSTEGQRSIKVTQAFTMTGGTLHFIINGNDCKGIKGDASVTINGGTVDVQVSGTGSHAISSDTDVVIGGTADITVVSSSQDGKCIKSDGTVHINNGTVHLTHSGDISKGISATGDIIIANGNITITASGSTVLENVNNQNVPAYCTAIKSDANITISNGTFVITLPTSNHGGKAISADGSLTIEDGDFTITTQGDGASYTISGNNKDAYACCCLRSDGNMSILSGNLTLSCSGAGGKGINVGDDSHTSSTLTIGTTSSGPTLSVTTTGDRITISSGGGGPWGGGGNYSNSKAIKARGTITINNGTMEVSTTKTGAEGLESKTQINIEGGMNYFSCKDDCINSSGRIFFNGGVTVCYGFGNDAVDSNAGTAGAITIGNGVVFAYTTQGDPEEGFDCDNNNYIRITGTGIGISAGGSQGGGGTIQNPAQGYKFYTSSYTYQTGRYYTLSNASGSGGTNMITFSVEGNCTSRLSLFTATGMVSGNTYYMKYGNSVPTNPTTSFHGIYLGGTSSASSQAFSFTAQ